jgi:hypothetical protein
MKTSLVQLKAQLKLIQEDHLFLNSFFWGDLHRAYGEGGAANGTDEVQYPIMCCYEAPSGGNMARLLTGVSLIIVVADKTFKDYTSLDDTTSDTLQCCRDIHNTLKRSPRWRQILTVRSASVSRFIDKGDDMITGHILQLQADLKDSESYCNLPMGDYDFEGETDPLVPCAPSTIVNSTATYLQDVDSGATFQLPDVTNIDTDGSPVVTPAQTPFVCSTPTGIAYRNIRGTGQWTSYRVGDEGYHAQLGTYQRSFTGVKTELDYSTSAFFLTMLNNNAFGNKSRFTNDLGGAVTDGSDGSTALYVVDHDTGLGWDIELQGSGNWNASIDYANSRTVGIYNDFRQPSLQEVDSITDSSRPVNVHDYPPFNITLAFYTGTTFAASTGRAYVIANNGDYALLNKAVVYRSITVRNHY